MRLRVLSDLADSVWRVAADCAWPTGAAAARHEMLVVRKEGQAHDAYSSFRSAYEILGRVLALNLQHRVRSLRKADENAGSRAVPLAARS